MISFIVDFTPSNFEDYPIRIEQSKIRMALVQAGLYNLTVHMHRQQGKLGLTFEGHEPDIRAAKEILSAWPVA